MCVLFIQHCNLIFFQLAGVPWIASVQEGIYLPPAGLCQELGSTRTAEGLIEGGTVAFGRSDYDEMSQAVVQQRRGLMEQLM